VAQREPRREAVPVVPAPAELVGQRAERQRGVGDAAREHDVGAPRQRLGNGLRAEVGVGEQHPLANGRDVGAGVHVDKRLARGAQLVDAPEHRVAGDGGDLRRPAPGAERAGEGFARRLGVEAARVQHELHAVLRRERPELQEHRHAVAGVAGRGFSGFVLLPVLLQDGERQFRQVVGGDVLHAAPLDRSAYRLPGVAVEAEPRADADVLVALPMRKFSLVSARTKSNCLLEFRGEETFLSQVLQLLLAGVAQGCVYALVALGFVLIYKATETVNFAQGDLMMLGGFFALTASVIMGWPYWATIVFAVVVMAMVGMLAERLVLRPVLGQPAFTVVMITSAWATCCAAWSPWCPLGTDTYQIATPFADEVWNLGA